MADRQRAAQIARGSGEESTSAAPSRVFLLLYLTFAIGAGARSAFQLLTRASHAPLAYTLSAVAAVVYTVGLVLLARWGHGAKRTAMWTLCIVELVGVFGIGALSMLRRDLFPDATVWSQFGRGYLYLPAVLPIGVMVWLHRTRHEQEPGSVGADA